MTDEYDFRLRPGRVRSKGGERVRPFIQQALAAAQRAGGTVSRQGRIGQGNRSRLGVGQRASVVANRFITNRSRGAVVKARVVRDIGAGGKLGAHLAYLRREGVTRDGERAQLFGPDRDRVDATAFTERCEDDRHHFRFIVSPDDALEMADLRSFTRDLMTQAERDLGTKLDWVAVDHWNTEHPHIHVIVRGVRDDGENLVIARDYIREGMRDRARDLITQELGPRTDQEIRRTLSAQIDAERFTNLDRQLIRDAARHGVVDMAPASGVTPDEFHAEKIGRLRKLQSLGLAEQIAPGQWALSEATEATLRELGERGDVIKRIHRGLTANGIERSTAGYVLAGESIDDPVTGRLIERGLDDELKGSAYAVIDGTDGRTHHIRLANLDAAGDSAPGSIVELRAFDDVSGMRRVALAVRSDLSIEAQITASGSTWLDRQAIAREPGALGSGGFGAEVQAAMERRAEHLIGQGLAERRGEGVSFARNLIETLKQRELDVVGESLAAETGHPFNKATTGEYVSGTYRQRLTLASGRFAMIDDGLGFQLVPWTPSIEKQLGRHVSGVARHDGGVDWSFGRKRGIGM
jgi:type IV secretory pathway VirD2 relaxase